MNTLVFDTPGPRGRRRLLMIEAVFYLFLALIIAWALKVLAGGGFFDVDSWLPFTQGELWGFLGLGLWHNVSAALVGGVLSLILGTAIGMVLMVHNRLIQVVAWAYVEVFRSVPVLLLLFFIASFFPSIGWDLGDFWFLVTALSLYATASIALIVRAGILALPRGQHEGASALGLSHWQAQRKVVLPQAMRAMQPAILSQLVILFKGTSLAYVLGGYTELLRSSNIVGQYYSQSLLQAFFVTSVIFLIINLILAWVTGYSERRVRRKLRAPSVGVQDPV